MEENVKTVISGLAGMLAHYHAGEQVALPFLSYIDRNIVHALT